MSVFRNLDCLSLAVCSNTTLLKLQTVLLLFFFEIGGAAYLWMRLIYGCGLYTDVYGSCHVIISIYMHRFIFIYKCFNIPTGSDYCIYYNILGHYTYMNINLDVPC